jgi:hypothetical protein
MEPLEYKGEHSIFQIYGGDKMLMYMIAAAKVGSHLRFHSITLTVTYRRMIPNTTELIIFIGIFC